MIQHGPHVIQYSDSVIYFLQKLQLHIGDVKDQFVIMKTLANHCNNLQLQGKLPAEIPILQEEIMHDKIYLIFGLLKALDQKK